MQEKLNSHIDLRLPTKEEHQRNLEILSQLREGVKHD